MRRPKIAVLLAAAGAAFVLAACGAMMAKPDMTFFVSSTGSGKGGDLGGLAGADRLCSSLATAAGSSGHTCVPISARSLRAERRGSMRATGSAPAHGATPRASSSRRT